MMKKIIFLSIFIAINVCNAETIGARAFSIPELWFERFVVTIPQNVNRENITTTTYCSKITPFVHYQVNLSFSEKEGITANAEIIQNPVVTIQYFIHQNKTDHSGPFLIAKNIKGTVNISGNFTQVGKIENGKKRYQITLDSCEQIACEQGRFFRIVRNCFSGIYEVNLHTNEIYPVQ